MVVSRKAWMVTPQIFWGSGGHCGRARNWPGADEPYAQSVPVAEKQSANGKFAPQPAKTALQRQATARMSRFVLGRDGAKAPIIGD
jgi:hypothetical protein